MKRYHFDLVDTNSVVDAGGSLLDDDVQAGKIAQDLARGVRGSRPELIGRGYKVVVRNDSGAEVSRTDVDLPKDKSRREPINLSDKNLG
jgi:hypothetical protein